MLQRTSCFFFRQYYRGTLSNRSRTMGRSRDRDRDNDSVWLSASRRIRKLFFGDRVHRQVCRSISRHHVETGEEPLSSMSQLGCRVFVDAPRRGAAVTGSVAPSSGVPPHCQAVSCIRINEKIISRIFLIADQTKSLYRTAVRACDFCSRARRLAVSGRAGERSP